MIRGAAVTAFAIASYSIFFSLLTIYGAGVATPDPPMEAPPLAVFSVNSLSNRFHIHSIQYRDDDMHFLMTNDVESFSIPLNRLDYDTAREVYKVGLPRLLDIYAKHDIKCTFYFTGEIVEIIPEAVDIVLDHGHDIGCHGYDHSHEKAFDVMSFHEQVVELRKAKSVIEKFAGSVQDFRAPALRINEYTIRALEETGFNTDSSIASVFKKGNSKILEMPIAALLFSYIGTTMRVSPVILRYLEKALFGDVIRRELKIHNLGMRAIKLIDGVIKRAKDKGFEFKSVQDYRKQSHRCDL